MHQRLLLIAILVVGTLAAAAQADEVILKNGDRLTGTVLSVDGGKLKIKTDLAGELSIDLANIQTFTSAKSAQIRLKDGQIIRDPVTSAEPIAPAPATQPTAEVVAGGKKIPVTDIKRMNASSVWTGSVVLAGSLARGNTHSSDLGIGFNAAMRRDDEFHDDRFSLAGAYNYGDQTINGTKTTSADNWFGQVKYDKFFSEKWYGFGLFRVDHDRLADLNYRLAPGVGAGYQWIESADLNFSTEAGVSYVYEDYTNADADERVALRLAYHVDKALNPSVKIFHNLEWLPAIDDPSDCNLNADAGVQAKLTGKLFSEFKVVYQLDTTPAPGALENDIRFVLGLGWQF